MHDNITERSVTAIMGTRLVKGVLQYALQHDI